MSPDIRNSALRIAFFDNGPLSYTPITPHQEPLGGTESAASYLSAALVQRGHEVVLINRTTARDPILGVEVPGPSAVNKAFLNGCDAVIPLSRSTGRQLRQRGYDGRLVCWQHRSSTFGGIESLAAPDERSAWDGFVFVSDRQRQDFKERFDLDGVVIRNAASPGALAGGLAPQSFAERGSEPVLIYASAPGRGLDLLLLSFPAMREALPGVTLRICSDQGIYQAAGADDPYNAYYAVARALDGVEFIGSLSQASLGAAFAAADILAYPTNFIETSCIVAMEAAVAGCLVMGTDIGALSETMNGYGVFTPFLSERATVVRDFSKLLIATVAAAKADPTAFGARRAEQAAWFRETHTWEKRAQEWEAYLAGPLGQAV
jgi:glycosyltransferase involved in cell wall biosynthesis